MFRPHKLNSLGEVLCLGPKKQNRMTVLDLNW